MKYPRLGREVGIFFCAAVRRGKLFVQRWVGAIVCAAMGESHCLCSDKARFLRDSEVFLRGSETLLWLYKVGAATDHRSTQAQKIPASDETGIRYIIRLGITQRGLIHHPQA